MSDDDARALRIAEKKALDARHDARQLAAQNAKLTETLKQARQRLEAANQQIAAMGTPPLTYALVLAPPRDGEIDLDVGGRRLRVALGPELDADGVTPGSEVLVNESMVAVATAPAPRAGQLAVVRELLDDPARVIVAGHNGEDRIVEVAPSVTGLRHGDTVAIDPRGRLVFERVPRQDVEDLVLEEIPQLDYSAIGGLAEQIEQVRDAVELPFVHRELFDAYHLAPPKGVLLYGPPGCGKTMIAKAVAHSLAEATAATSGAHSYFLNIKGPELLNKYVGETERQIRVIFQRARERASAGMPVIVFFDEMDSLFRTRGSGVSSDVENTIVPQLLSEIDGVESLANVIIIGASNREDMIDPAILRPGRLDVKIKLDRPDEAAAREIFGKYLTDAVPLHPEAPDHQQLIDGVAAFLYRRDDETRFLEVTYANGETEVLHFADFASGAMIHNVVGRAKKAAIKRELATGERGITADDLRTGVVAEFTENEDLPNTTNPDDWARISGRRGVRVAHARSLVSRD